MWSTKPVRKITDAYFRDSAVIDEAEKTVVSMRDGILEYLGAELGLEPSDKIFKVYRSPATIAQATKLMDNIPITDGHVEPEGEVSDSLGYITDSDFIDQVDELQKSTIAIKNKYRPEKKLLDKLKDGKREASLGYKASFIESNRKGFDFEQQNIKPHHLAIVEKGRCGESCSFIDNMGAKMPEQMKAESEDMDKTETESNDMDNVMEMLGALTERLAKLEEMMKPSEDEYMEKESEDSKPLTDSQEFKDAAQAVAKSYAAAITKGVKILDSEFDFSNKTPLEIMKACVEQVQGKDHGFTDDEIPVAFKLLKSEESQYKDFGDSAKTSPLNVLSDKEF
jgi:hypothetical protein